MDPCVFYCNGAIMVLYVDNCIVMSKNSTTVDNIVKSLKTGEDPDNPSKRYKNKYSLTNDGGIKNYLGVNVIRNDKDN